MDEVNQTERALTIFRMVATEFGDMPDNDTLDEETGKTVPGITSFMDIFKDQISEKRFGSTYAKALAYLTAHKLKMYGYGDTTNGAIGDSLRVASYQEGETSISYSTNQGTNLQVNAEYALTPYGLEFLTLLRNAVIPIINAGEAKSYVPEDY